MLAIKKVLAATKLNNISKKQWQDIALFSAACYIMYEYGGELSSYCDKMMPNEEEMMKMMEQEMEMMKQ